MANFICKSIKDIPLSEFKDFTLTKETLMRTMEKNTKRQLVENYIKTYSPFESKPLGVNVSAILNLAQKKGCAAKDLREAYTYGWTNTIL